MVKPKFNPYIIGSPVHGAAFYGREKLVNVVETALAVNTVNLLVFYGQRRMGKTSLLQNMPLRDELKDNFVFVYVDTVDIYNRKAVDVLSYFTQKIVEAIPDSELLSLANLKQDSDSFRSQFLPTVYQAIGKKRLVILLDEFDIFEYKAGKLDPNSLDSALRTIEQLIRHESELAFIVAVGRGEEYGYAALNQVIRTGHWEKISLLEEEDTYKLITEPVKDTLNYQPEAIEEIRKLSAGHPYYTQLICYEIFNELQTIEGQEVRVADVRTAATKALETGSGGFNWLWEGFSPAERLMACLIAEAGHHTSEHTVTSTQLEATFKEFRIFRRSPEFNEALNGLTALDILQQSGPIKNIEYRYIVELVRNWICQEHPLAQERPNLLPHLSVRAAAEFEKGEKADTLQVALEHYRSAVASNPNHLQAQLALGQALENKGSMLEALSAFEAALWLDPENDTIRHKRDTIKLPQPPQSEGQSPRNRLPIFMVIGIIVLVLIGFFGYNAFGGATGTSIPTATIAAVTPTDTLTPQPTVEPSIISTNEPTIMPQPTVAPTVEEITPTATELEPTASLTAPPVDTSTPVSPAPTSTHTPVPPLPTSTNTPPTVTDTPVSEPAATSVPVVVKPTYSAPALLSPVQDTALSSGDEVILRWESVGELAENEQYAVRLIYQSQEEEQWSGDQLHSTEWILPRRFLEQVDGPDFKFKWFVYIERVNDGQTEAVSPNSETWTFYWKRG
ncbi:MAG: AAA family ATPase [Anaerolineae bacterium]|nr:AAA family ATPase [Anaerolineae bacterium]